ncbi:MAG: hypothetical protein K6T30_00150 [Alicyclobacillus sp.]|nr:hypothetical protein [Alicyclobacillus sp.]
MNVVISPEAARWFKREYTLGPGIGIRVYARYGGYSDIHPGFSLGITPGPVARAVARGETEGVCVFIEEEDLWYFGGADLYIHYVAEEDELVLAVTDAAASPSAVEHGKGCT